MQAFATVVRPLCAATPRCALAMLAWVAAARGQSVQWHELRKQDLPSAVAGTTGGVLVDVDGDSDLDYVAGTPLTVLANDGTGRFTPLPAPSLPAALSPRTADVDGDGDEDIVFWGGVLLVQAGAPLVAVPTNFGVVHECADFTGDGRADVLANGLWVSQPGGSFARVTIPPLPSTFEDTEAADLDADGDLDLVFGRRPAGIDPGTEIVWRNDGPGVFTDVTSQWFPSALNDATPFVVAGDFDADSDVDLALAGRNAGQSVWTFRQNNGVGVLQPWVTANTSGRDYTDGAIDLDVDGDLDLPGMTGWLRNDGAGVFTHVAFADPANHLLFAFGDVDGDGRPDLVGSTETGDARLLLNKLPGPFVDATRSAGIPLSDSSAAVAVGDADGDGDADFVRGYRLHRNDGSGWSEPWVVWPAGFSALCIADVDGDGDGDVVGHRGPGTVEVQTNLGAGGWALGQSVAVPGAALAAFDADGDGDVDLLLAGIRLLRNDGTGLFTLDPAVPVAGGNSTCAAVADFDGDGDSDVLAGDSQRLHMFVNDGTGALAWSPTRLGVFSPIHVRSIVAFDADGDQDVDALVTHTGSGPPWLVRNVGGGTLGPTTGLLPSDLLAAHESDAGDIDGDGDQDLVIWHVWILGGVRVLRNDGTGLMSNDANVPGGARGAPKLVDIDGDGDLDLAVDRRMFVNRGWHAHAPNLAVAGRDYRVEFGGKEMPTGMAVPFLGLRARWPLPPFGTIGLDLGSAVPLPLVPVTGEAGALSIPIPADAALVGAQFGVQAILMDGSSFHLSPVVYDTVL